MGRMKGRRRWFLMGPSSIPGTLGRHADKFVGYDQRARDYCRRSNSDSRAFFAYGTTGGTAIMGTGHGGVGIVGSGEVFQRADPSRVLYHAHSERDIGYYIRGFGGSATHRSSTSLLSLSTSSGIMKPLERILSQEELKAPLSEAHPPQASALRRRGSLSGRSRVFSADQNGGGGGRGGIGG
jgi:hypothetical protein